MTRLILSWAKTMSKKAEKFFATSDPTLCWDCANATKPWKCEWVARGEPVPGWEARRTTVNRAWQPFESCHVIRCPKLDLDAHCGGMIKRMPTIDKHRAKTRLDDKSMRALAEAIVERQAMDWMELDFGRFKTVTRYGARIKREDVVLFFNSEDCDNLLALFTDWRACNIRRWLGIQTLVKR